MTIKQSGQEAYSKNENALFQVSNSPRGPWDGSPKWTSRAALLDEYVELDDQVASFLEDDGDEANWYIKYPDGRVEVVDYYGEHVGWHSTW